MKKISSKILLHIIGWGLFAWGFLTFGIIPAVARFDWIPKTVELPLGSLESVAVDSQGRIYCVAAYYSRIQAYAPNGEFLHGWQVGGIRTYTIRANNNDEIEVLTYGKMAYRYSFSGELLESHPIPKDFGPPEGMPGHEIIFSKCTDNDEREYSIRNELIYPHVVCRDANGPTKIAVPPPRLSWFLMGPLPAFAFIFIAFVWLLAINPRYRQRLGKQHRKNS